MLVPVPGYPIVFEKADEDEDAQPPDNSLYKEDGSLEVISTSDENYPFYFFFLLGKW